MKDLTGHINPEIDTHPLSLELEAILAFIIKWKDKHMVMYAGSTILLSNKNKSATVQLVRALSSAPKIADRTQVQGLCQTQLIDVSDTLSSLSQNNKKETRKKMKGMI